MHPDRLMAPPRVSGRRFMSRSQIGDSKRGKTMHPLCENCAGGPCGDYGHSDLLPDGAGPHPVHDLFRCLSCGARWIRHPGGPCRYEWLCCGVPPHHPIRRSHIERAAQGPVV
jgi:hypothetical protein